MNCIFRKMANKVYSQTFIQTVAGLTTAAGSFRIQSPNRQIKLKSIAVDWLIRDGATNATIPYRTATDQQLTLIVGNTFDKFCQAFSYVSGITASYQGNFIYITEPKQYLFDSFFIASEIGFNLSLINLNAAARDHLCSIIVETEEKTIFR